MRKKDIEKFIEEATIDCYNNEECIAGFYTMIDDNLEFPCMASVVGTEITVVGVDLEDDRIMALCQSDGKKYAIDILSVVFNTKITGLEWVAAYRVWHKNGA